MTAQAEKVDIVNLQQSGIGRPMRRVAREATFVCLDWGVLENERAHRIRVAFRADCKLARCRPHLVTCLRAVRVVAITTLNETDIDSMPVRPGKLRFLSCMAAVAELSLRLHQHEVYVGGFVRAVTTGATYAIRQMFRFREVLGFNAGLMTLSADCGSLGRAEGFEPDDLGDVASAINVRLTGAMAGLTSVLVALQEGRMWRSSKVFLPYFLVAGLTNVGFRVLTVARPYEDC